jgi:hypothetical protein
MKKSIYKSLNNPYRPPVPGIRQPASSLTARGAMANQINFYLLFFSDTALAVGDG